MRQQSTRRTQGDSGDDVSTYRYLRIAIVVVVLTLLVSLMLERHAATCWQDSISSYYYTPVHAIFVASLGVIGVALFVIRGGTWVEEVLLNQAGFLAPVVAFVPTGWSSSDCPSNLTATSKGAVDQLLHGNRFFAKFSGNNLVAFVVGGMIAVVLIQVVVAVAGKKQTLVRRTELVVPALGSGAVVLAGLIWHLIWPASFNAHAHAYSATLMFALVGIVMTLTARRDQTRRYRALYYACAEAMAAGFVVVVVVGSLVTWNHKVLVLEGIEATAFVVFWFGQTIQLWDAEPGPGRIEQTG